MWYYLTMIKDTNMLSNTITQLRALVEAYIERRFDPAITTEASAELDLVILDLEQIIRNATKNG